MGCQYLWLSTDPEPVMKDQSLSPQPGVFTDHQGQSETSEVAGTSSVSVSAAVLGLSRWTQYEMVVGDGVFDQLTRIRLRPGCCFILPLLCIASFERRRLLHRHHSGLTELGGSSPFGSEAEHCRYRRQSRSTAQAVRAKRQCPQNYLTRLEPLTAL